jgi:hypothetical protein
MGVVYVSREDNEDRFTVGAAKSFAQRRKCGYSRYNLRLKIYKLIKTPDHFVLEKFLHNELAEKRIRDIRSESWYAVSAKEMDLAIERAETLGREHVARKRRVTEIKSTKSDGTWLEPTQRLIEIRSALSELEVQLSPLLRKKQILVIEAQACIGSSDGVDGLFEWQSHEQYQFQMPIFKEQYPELYDSFRELTYVRRFKLWGNTDDDLDVGDDES